MKDLLMPITSRPITSPLLLVRSDKVSCDEMVTAVTFESEAAFGLNVQLCDH